MHACANNNVCFMLFHKSQLEHSLCNLVSFGTAFHSQILANHYYCIVVHGDTQVPGPECCSDESPHNFNLGIHIPFSVKDDSAEWALITVHLQPVFLAGSNIISLLYLYNTLNTEILKTNIQKMLSISLLYEYWSPYPSNMVAM